MSAPFKEAGLFAALFVTSACWSTSRRPLPYPRHETSEFQRPGNSATAQRDRNYPLRLRVLDSGWRYRSPANPSLSDFTALTMTTDSWFISFNRDGSAIDRR